MVWANLIQLYDYQMFDDIDLPDGIDKEILINSIMDKCRLNIPVFDSFDLLQAKIQNFFKKYKVTFERLYFAYTSDFNPIENYDRIEDHTTRRTGKDITRVSPYDTNAFINDSEMSADNETIISSRVHGNIGVTTAPQMLRENAEVLPMINIYIVISDMFYNEFCIYTM